MHGGGDAVEFRLRKNDGLDGRGEGQGGAFAQDDEFDEVRRKGNDLTRSAEAVAETVFGIAAAVTRPERPEQGFGASGQTAGFGHPKPPDIS